MEPITHDLLQTMLANAEETKKKQEAVRREALRSEIRAMIPAYDLNNLYHDLRLKLETALPNHLGKSHISLTLDCGIYDRLERLRDVHGLQYRGLDDAFGLYIEMFRNLYYDWFNTYFPISTLEFTHTLFGSVNLVIPLPPSSKVSAQI